MTRKSRDLYQKMPADATDRVEARVKQALKEMPRSIERYGSLKVARRRSMAVPRTS